MASSSCGVRSLREANHAWMLLSFIELSFLLKSVWIAGSMGEAAMQNGDAIESALARQWLMMVVFMESGGCGRDGWLIV